MAQLFQSRQAEIERRRQMAQALLGQSMEPIEQPPVAGAHISPLQGWAKIAQALIGNLQGRRVDRQQRELDTERQVDIQNQLARLIQSQQPPAPEMPSPFAPSMQNRTMTPPYDPLAAMGSEHPVVQQLAGSLLGQRFKREEEEREAQRRQAEMASQQQFQRGMFQDEAGLRRELANMPEYMNAPGIGVVQRSGAGASGQVVTPEPTSQPTNAFQLWQAQNPQGRIEDWLAMNRPSAPATAPNTPFEVWRAQNANAPIEDWFKVSNARSGLATVAEKRAMGFFDRVYNAKTAIDSMQEDIKKLDLGGQVRLTLAPNVLQTPLGKRFNQAAGEFINAALRRESGAAITESEYERFGKIYFPQPGDDSPTLAQKAQARLSVLESLKREAGNAYMETYGDAEPPAAPTAPGGISVKPGGAVERLLKGQ